MQAYAVPGTVWPVVATTRDEKPAGSWMPLASAAPSGPQGPLPAAAAKTRGQAAAPMVKAVPPRAAARRRSHCMPGPYGSPLNGGTGADERLPAPGLNVG